jgi:5'(3')-deoxyribonucleotidase
MGDVVLIDMDAVLTDFNFAFVKRWAQIFPNERCPIREAQEAFASRTPLPTRLRKKAVSVYLSPGLFIDMRPMPGARSALTEMRRCDLEPYICTAPMPGHKTCLSEKQEWVARHLPRFMRGRLNIALDKTMVRGRWLIDDLPNVRGIMKPEWTQIIFSAPYNDHVTDAPRISSWNAWKRTFAELGAISAP